MRIIGGALRGRALVAPKGQSTRPTADRAREALFNVLEHAAFAPALEGARVLDLFAGSGALGLEALSRGAAFVRFVERARPAVLAVRENLERLGLADRGEVQETDACRLGVSTTAPFDLVFLDPPYGQGLAERALAALAAGGWLAPDALLVVERGVGESPLPAPGFTDLAERVWGAALVNFLRPAGNLSPGPAR